MQNIYPSDELHNDIWYRPWDKEQTDNLYERDDRFFSLVMKGVLAFLNKNVILNGNSINHFIFNTGSSIMYVEQNGYNFSWCETTGEDQMYMKMPRCIVEFGDVNISPEELTSPYVRGTYERLSSIDNKIKGYNAEIRRLPIEISVSLKYVLSTFNESIILLEELMSKLIFQRYFDIVYLGQKIKCSIEFPSSNKIEVNKIDMTSTEVNQKTINLDVKICTNYPIIDLRTEIKSSAIIQTFGVEIDIEKRSDIVDTETVNIN